MVLVILYVLKHMSPMASMIELRRTVLSSIRITKDCRYDIYMRLKRAS